jgi:haloalkane dehalogenase
MSADALEGLPDFPYTSQFRTWDGLRLAHLDEGEGAPVLMQHGEPTWSFLWRKVLPPVRDAGFRVICPDLPGFGRSEKPTDLGWYSYDRHTAALGALLEDLDLRGVTMVVHDWGGPIGLRVAAEHRDRVDRLVVMDTGLFTGHQKMSEAWLAFRAFVERTEDLPVGMLVRRGCFTDPGRRGRRRLRRPVPRRGEQGRHARLPAHAAHVARRAGRGAGQRTAEALRDDPRDKLPAVGRERPDPLHGDRQRLAAHLGADARRRSPRPATSCRRTRAS